MRAHFSFLSAPALTNTDLFLQFGKQALLFQTVQRIHQHTIACTAGLNLIHIIRNIQDTAALWHILIIYAFHGNDVCSRKISAADTQFFRQSHIRNIVRAIPQQLTYIRIRQYRIHCSHHAVFHQRMTPIFKIRITANMIDHNKVLLQRCIQMSDRSVQSLRMKRPLFRIRDQPFHIL